MQETITVGLTEVQPFRALAVRTPMTPDKSGTRKAWSELTARITLDDSRLSAGPSAYVFIPQEQWSGSVDTLWVGIAVDEFGDVPEGVERLEIGGGWCVTAEVYGDEEHMWRVYDAVFAWLRDSKEYELDTRAGVLGLETVPLEPVNALTVPYEAVRTFRFTILYPVRKR
ncbi:GyrI-like domain-containing protein [Paenibacillus sp. CC-CFT747]|nr:GyrI-like domain-containing protein [Paenibacillus sp. CC-CFT747]